MEKNREARVPMNTGKALLSTTSERETFAVGEALGGLLKRGTVIALDGDLGAGKTVLVKGATSGLGVERQVRSPTFNLLQVYHGRVPVYHFDFYRLEDEAELLEIGFQEYMDDTEGVVFIEWALKFPRELPGERLEIFLEYENSGEPGTSKHRKLYLMPRGEYYRELLDNLLETNQYDYRGRLNPREITLCDTGGEEKGGD